jgi:hypothetical protein
MRIAHLVVLVTLLGTLAACPAPADLSEVPITVLAGPTCPVVTDPPDPACADRPVEGAELVIVGADRRRVASVRTDAQGVATVRLAQGSYGVQPQPVEGLMGTPAELELVVGEGPVGLTVTYDTGIR